MRKRWDRMALSAAFLVGFLLYELFRYRDPANKALWDSGFGAFVCFMYGLSVVAPILRLRILKQRRLDARSAGSAGNHLAS